MNTRLAANGRRADAKGFARRAGGAGSAQCHRERIREVINGPIAYAVPRRGNGVQV
jgi:hypothetical protein